MGRNTKDVYVVAPRYGAGDVVVWESVNYGISFGAPQTYTNYADGTTVDDVLLAPFISSDEFSISSYNPELGYTWLAPSVLGVTSHEFVFNAEDVESGTSGFAGAEIVEAYSTVSGPLRVGYYYDESDYDLQPNQWSRPGLVGSGEDPLLAEVSSGLLLLDYYVDAKGDGNLELRPGTLQSTSSVQ